MTPEQRRLRAQIAANTRWSRPMAREDQAEAARSAFYARLERQVDPQGRLPPDERERRVRAAARAFSARLNSAKAKKDPPAFHTSLENRRINPASAPATTPGRGIPRFPPIFPKLSREQSRINSSSQPVARLTIPTFPRSQCQQPQETRKANPVRPTAFSPLGHLLASILEYRKPSAARLFAC